MQKERAISILDRIRDKKVLIIGDIMLDEYLWGTVDRISPEAPVPVVKVTKNTFAIGGAANVALNAHSLGAVPVLVGVTGSDNTGKKLKSLIKKNGIGVNGIFVEKRRPTILKKRIVAHNQQVVRVDIEESHPIDTKTEDKILTFLYKFKNDLCGIIIEDYNKGLLTKHLITEIISFAIEMGIPVSVDPKFEHFYDYYGTTIFKPNIRELERVCGVVLSDRSEIEKALRGVLKRIKAEAVLLTMGNQGMLLLEKRSRAYYVKPHSIDVYDVTGAGDTVIAAVTLASANGMSLKESTRFASIAAAIEIRKLGASAVSPEEIMDFCS